MEIQQIVCDNTTCAITRIAFGGEYYESLSEFVRIRFGYLVVKDLINPPCRAESEKK